jgi:hypothetical protein
MDRRKPTNQLPQETQKGRCVLSGINRAPIGAAVFLFAKSYFSGNRFAALISARATPACEEAFFVFFVAIGLLIWVSRVIGKSYAKKSMLKVSSTEKHWEQNYFPSLSESLPG